MLEAQAICSPDTDLDPDDYPLLDLEDATVLTSRRGRSEDLVDLFDALNPAKGICKVRGKLQMVPRRYKNIVRNESVYDELLTIPRVETWSVERIGNKGGLHYVRIWVLGKFAWYGIKPAPEYQALFDVMLDKANAWLFLCDKHKDVPARGKIKVPVTKLYKDFAQFDPSCPDEAAAQRFFHRHQESLFNIMHKIGVDTDMWKRTPIYEAFQKAMLEPSPQTTPVQELEPEREALTELERRPGRPKQGKGKGKKPSESRSGHEPNELGSPTKQKVARAIRSRPSDPEMIEHEEAASKSEPEYGVGIGKRPLETEPGNRSRESDGPIKRKITRSTRLRLGDAEMTDEEMQKNSGSDKKHGKGKGKKPPERSPGKAFTGKLRVMRATRSRPAEPEGAMEMEEDKEPEPKPEYGLGKGKKPPEKNSRKAGKVVKQPSTRILRSKAEEPAPPPAKNLVLSTPKPTRSKRSQPVEWPSSNETVDSYTSEVIVVRSQILFDPVTPVSQSQDDGNEDEDRAEDADADSESDPESPRAVRGHSSKGTSTLRPSHSKVIVIEDDDDEPASIASPVMELLQRRPQQESPSMTRRKLRSMKTPSPSPPADTEMSNVPLRNKRKRVLESSRPPPQRRLRSTRSAVGEDAEIDAMDADGISVKAESEVEADEEMLEEVRPKSAPISPARPEPLRWDCREPGCDFSVANHKTRDGSHLIQRHYELHGKLVNEALETVHEVEDLGKGYQMNNLLAKLQQMSNQWTDSKPSPLKGLGG